MPVKEIVEVIELNLIRLEMSHSNKQGQQNLSSYDKFYNLFLGPLMYNNKGRATVVGVVSTGVGCGEDKYPGIFGRVTSVLDWINDELNKTCIDFEDQN